MSDSDECNLEYNLSHPGAQKQLELDISPYLRDPQPLRPALVRTKYRNTPFAVFDQHKSVAYFDSLMDAKKALLARGVAFDDSILEQFGSGRQVRPIPFAHCHGGRVHFRRWSQVRATVAREWQIDTDKWEVWLKHNSQSSKAFLLSSQESWSAAMFHLLSKRSYSSIELFVVIVPVRPDKPLSKPPHPTDALHAKHSEKRCDEALKSSGMKVSDASTATLSEDAHVEPAIDVAAEHSNISSEVVLAQDQTRESPGRISGRTPAGPETDVSALVTSLASLVGTFTSLGSDASLAAAPLAAAESVLSSLAPQRQHPDTAEHQSSNPGHTTSASAPRSGRASSRPGSETSDGFVGVEPVE